MSNTTDGWNARLVEGWREEEGHIIPAGSSLKIVKRGLKINREMSKRAGFGAKPKRDSVQEI